MTEYLITFFKALGNLTENGHCGVSDAIAYDDGSLCVLVGMGDVRARVRIQEFDSDPVKAAELVVHKWKAMSEDELQREMEEVR